MDLHQFLNSTPQNTNYPVTNKLQTKHNTMHTNEVLKNFKTKVQFFKIIITT